MISLLLAATVALAPGLDGVLLSERIGMLERQAGGKLGVAVRDLRTGDTWSHRGSEPRPMQSVFKLPLAIVALHDARSGRLNLDERLVVRRSDLSIPHSPINARFVGDSQTFTYRQLLDASVLESDNTAADLLMRRLGGPVRVTRVLRSLGVHGVRIDRYESELNTEYQGLGRFRPEWADEAALERAIASVPLAKQREALQRFMRDPRDTATPAGMLALLTDLQKGRLLHPADTQYLLTRMRQTRTGAQRFATGLPPGSTLAHRTGAGRTVDGVGGAMNQVAIAELPDGRKLAIVALLTGSTLPWSERERALALVARAVDDAAVDRSAPGL